MNFYRGYICENGHPVHVLDGPCSDNFCSICGAPVISECPECTGTIRGHQVHFSGYFKPAAYCHDCGAPYPWTKIAIQATIDLLAEEIDLPENDRDRLIEVLPDTISETPKTALASVRFRKVLGSVSSFVGEGLRQFAIDFGCELLKKSLDLP